MNEANSQCGNCTTSVAPHAMEQIRDLLLCPTCAQFLRAAVEKRARREKVDVPPLLEDIVATYAQKVRDQGQEAKAAAAEKAAEYREWRDQREKQRIETISAARPAFEEQYEELVAHYDTEPDPPEPEPKPKAKPEPKPKAKPKVRGQVKQELARRVLCRRHLLPFVRRNVPGYEAGWVHKDLCRRLERFSQQVTARQSPRLMLFLPPRSGKSEVASKNFPAWHLGNNPSHDIIASSYSASLANDFSKRTRALVRDQDYADIFPGVTIDSENQNAEGWSTNKGGYYVPAGVEGPITGKGAHCLILDDLVKNREEAESKTRREAVFDWYTSTAYTRLAPGGGILLIITRWHTDDIAGRLLQEAEEGGEQWEVVSYPAIAVEDEEFRDKGEPLHPERYDLEALDRIKKAIGRRDWQALYQQDPVGEEGDYFTASDLRYYRPSDRPPLEDLTVYSAWDLAIGKQAHNDHTVGVVFGVDRSKNLWMLDEYRGKWGSLEIVDKLFEMYEKWEPSVTGIERTHVEQSIGPFLTEQKRQRGLFAFRIEPMKHGNRDKVARASAFRGLVEMNRVYLPSLSPWTDDYVVELLKFPNGKEDDRVDASAYLGQMISMFHTRPVPPKKRRPSWRDQLDKYVNAEGAGASHMSS